MAAVSMSISRGVSGTKMSDITVAASAPGAGDFEFRIANTAAITREDSVLALKAFIRVLETGGPSAVNLTTTPIL